MGNVLDSRQEVHNRITYTGQQFDNITQQYYLRARFYNPVVGRFPQEDVYRGDGLNLYDYCGNNPVIYYDPSGYAKNNTCKSKKRTSKDNVNYKSFTSKEITDTKFKSDTFKLVEVNGKVTISGYDGEFTIDRRMYQRNDIDWTLKDDNGLTNLERAKKGVAPIGKDGYALELHDLLQQEPGAMVEATRTSHRGKGNFNILHGFVEDGDSFRNNELLNKQYKNFKKNIGNGELLSYK